MSLEDYKSILKKARELLELVAQERTDLEYEIDDLAALKDRYAQEGSNLEANQKLRTEIREISIKYQPLLADSTNIFGPVPGISEKLQGQDFEEGVSNLSDVVTHYKMSPDDRSQRIQAIKELVIKSSPYFRKSRSSSIRMDSKMQEAIERLEKITGEYNKEWTEEKNTILTCNKSTFEICEEVERDIRMLKDKIEMYKPMIVDPPWAFGRGQYFETLFNNIKRYNTIPKEQYQKWLGDLRKSCEELNKVPEDYKNQTKENGVLNESS